MSPRKRRGLAEFLKIQCRNTYKLYKVTMEEEETWENALALRVGYREVLSFHVSFVKRDLH